MGAILNKTKPANLNGRKHKLTDRQTRFAAEYAVHGDGKRAAVAVGCSPKTAASVACQWLTLPRYAHVQKAVEEALAKKRQECEIEARDLLNQLLEIAYFDPGDLVNPATGEPLPLHKLPPHVRRAVQEFEVVTERLKDKGKGRVRRFLIPRKSWNKLAAIKQIAEQCGLEAPKKVEMDGHVGIGIDWLLSAPRSDAEVVDVVENMLNEPAALPPPEEDG